MDYLSLAFRIHSSSKPKIVHPVDSANLGSCSTAGFTTEKRSVYKWTSTVQSPVDQGSTWTIYMENIHSRLWGPFGGSFVKTHGTSLEIRVPSSVRTSPWHLELILLTLTAKALFHAEESWPAFDCHPSVELPVQERTDGSSACASWSTVLFIILPVITFNSHITGLCSWASAPTPSGPWGQVCILTVPTSVYFQFLAWAWLSPMLHKCIREIGCLGDYIIFNKPLGCQYWFLVKHKNFTIHLSIHHLSIQPATHLSKHPFIHPFIHPSMHPSKYPTIYPSNHPIIEKKMCNKTYSAMPFYGW